jgi:hypothetical protein
MKTDEALDLVEVGRFGARTVAAHAHGCPNPVKQLWRLGVGRGRTGHLAAFVASLPSRGQEIDCNFRPLGGSFASYELDPQ